MTTLPSPLPSNRILALIYARISEDPLDQRRGVTRQTNDLQDFAAVEDMFLLGEYSDNDASAHSGGARPDYDRLMAAAQELGPALAAAGKRLAVVAWMSSRLWRNRAERALAIEALQKARCLVIFEAGGRFDMLKASDRSQLASLGEGDTLESDLKSERVARAALERAQEGRANGVVAYGWRRQYEYDRRGRIIGFEDIEDPEQAAVVREIVRRLLGGESLIAITLDLNDRGVPSPGAGQERKLRAQGQDETGSRWNKTSVKKIALRKANMGVRVHTVDGITNEYPAAWPALISSEDHARVEALLADRATSGVRPGRRSSPGLRRHMLSWTEAGVCGECGSWLRVAMRGNRKRNSLAETYCCHSPAGCVGRNKDAVDKHVGEVVVSLLSDPRAMEIFKPDESAAMAALEKVAGLKARQALAAEDCATGLITRDQLLRMNRSFGEQIAEAQAEVKRLTPTFDPSVLDGLIGPGAEHAWETLEVAQKTAVLEALQIRVTLLKVGRRGPGYDPESVRIERLGVRL